MWDRLASALAAATGARSELRSWPELRVYLWCAWREQLLHDVLCFGRQVLVAEHARGDRQDCIRRGRAAQPCKEPDVIHVSIDPRGLDLERQQVFGRCGAHHNAWSLQRDHSLAVRACQKPLTPSLSQSEGTPGCRCATRAAAA